MFRATTPTHTWIVPLAPSMIQKIRITYKQDGKVILQKTEADCQKTQTGDSTGRIWVTLTQEETLLFDSSTDKRVSIQLRVLTTDGVVMASQIEKVFANECLDEEVLS